MKRREFITLLGAAAASWALTARAQQPTKIPRIGYLSPGSASAGLFSREVFQQGLRELGYVEGRNIAVEYRFAEGKFDRLGDFATELVKLKVDVIVAVVTQASLAAQKATNAIPIVMVGVSDPVGSGLVASLARPGANITGTSSMIGDLVGKSLELLKETVPKLARVGVLWNPANAVFQAQMLKAAEAAAGKLGVQLQTYGMRGPDEFGRNFAAITTDSVDALLVFADPMFALHQKSIVDFAESKHLPTIYGDKAFASSGGLMAYSIEWSSQFRSAATLVNKILKGARPSDLAVEQPTKFDLVINLKTTKALRLTIPQSILLRANEVIE